MAILDQININGVVHEIVPEIAPLFDTSTAYAIGDYVIKDATMYRFKTAHTAGAWNASQVDEVTVGSEIKDIKQATSEIDTLKADLNDKASESTIAPEFDSSASYTAGQYVYKNGVLYRFTSAHTGAWTGTDAEEVTVGSELNRLENSESGTGLTDDIKQALLTIAEKVAYIDEHGQDYYDALYDALYPPADLVSISAVYTQSGTVYDTDTLDSLKPDLVVTAHMSDSSTQIVTSYVLSGTLSTGTSTITVTYGGKTTTFTVTVSRVASLYPLPDGVYRDVPLNTCTISNGNHVKIEVNTRIGGGELFIDFKNELAGNSISILNNKPTWFTVPAESATFYIENVVNESDIPFEMNLRKANSSSSLVFSSGRGTHSDGFEVTATPSSQSDASSIFMYIPNAAISANTIIEFDIGFRVGTTEYITDNNYPLTNGTFNITEPRYSGILTISDGNHVKYQAVANSAGHRYINLTTGVLSEDIGTIQDQPKWFTIPNYKLAILEFKNVSNNGLAFASNFKIANSSNSSNFAINESVHTEDVTAQYELLEEQDIGCLFLYLGPITAGYEFEFDVSFVIDGVKYI